MYVEITGFGSEFGSVEVEPDGTVTVLTGTSPHGQGHETAFAQVASSVLGVPFEQVREVHSDTSKVPRGAGTMGSRSLQKGGSAVFQAGEKVLEKAKRVAGHLLEVAPEDIVLHEDGRLGVAGAPDRALTWQELATAANDPARLPEGMDPGLKDTADFDADTSFPFDSSFCFAAFGRLDAVLGRRA